MKLREFDQGPQARLGRVPAKDHSRMQLLDLAERYFRIGDSETDKVYSYGDLLESMKDWLRTGDASFSGDPITDHDGLALAYQEAFHPDEVRDDLKHDLKRMVFSLFCRHKSHFEKMMKFGSIAEFVSFPGFGRIRNYSAGRQRMMIFR